MNFFSVLLIGWKKYATLLPNNWLAKTPQALVPRRLGRQSAERERISEINSNLSTEKLCEYKISHSFYFGYTIGLLCIWEETVIGWKKYATLLPKNWLAETPQTLASRRLGRQSAERERISEINSNLPTSKLTIPLS
ncbi:hypothetical protein AB9M93_12810 [Peribacillus frigoritolerans]|uniref:hypothetical protein n=1 Tax=Peribacillus frigoritolerans TaxID=450367 RepID=UPI003518963D